MSLVVQNNNLIPGGQLILAEMGLSREETSTLQKGLVYLQGPEVDQWIERRRGDFENIARAVQRGVEIRDKLSGIQRCTQEALTSLEKIAGDRRELDGRVESAQATYERQRAQLSEQLEGVRNSLRDEHRIALFTFKNPLATKMGRAVASIGRYALDAMVPLVGALHRDTLAQNCHQVSLTAIQQCASTAFQPTFYVPLLVAGAVGYVCHKVHQIGQRILRNQREEIRLNGEVNARVQEHAAQAAQFVEQRGNLERSHTEQRRVLEAGEQERIVLDRENAQVDSFKERVRAAIMKDIVHREIAQLEQTFTYPPAIAAEVGQKSMMNVFDGILVAYSGKGASSVLAIQ